MFSSSVCVFSLCNFMVSAELMASGSADDYLPKQKIVENAKGVTVLTKTRLCIMNLLRCKDVPKLLGLSSVSTSCISNCFLVMLGFLVSEFHVV